MTILPRIFFRPWQKHIMGRKYQNLNAQLELQPGGGCNPAMYPTLERTAAGRPAAGRREGCVEQRRRGGGRWPGCLRGARGRSPGRTRTSLRCGSPPPPPVGSPASRCPKCVPKMHWQIHDSPAAPHPKKLVVEGKSGIV